MLAKEQLGELRVKIDEIDEQMILLFEKRMSIAENIAEIKSNYDIPVLDAAREQQVVDRAVSFAGSHLQSEAALFMRAVMAISREYQSKRLREIQAPLSPEPKQPAGGNGDTAGIKR